MCRATIMDRIEDGLMRERGVCLIKIDAGLRDNGGRRSSIDRRRFSYSGHIPERRSGEDRRIDLDRRMGIDRRCDPDRRSGIDRRTGRAQVIDLLNVRSGKERRRLEDRRTGEERRSLSSY